MSERRRRLQALDLFCGAGGVTKGLQRAGFHVTGIDNRPQPRYCGDIFILGNACDPQVRLSDFDFIWASPPCQAFSVAAKCRRESGHRYPNLIPKVRRLLQSSGAEWCIENVPGSPLDVTIRLNGYMFPTLKVIRERWFELSWEMRDPFIKPPRGLLQKGYISVAGKGTQGWAYKMGMRWSAADVGRAMNIDWMTRAELSQAIPPEYAECIGKAAMRRIRRKGK